MLLLLQLPPEMKASDLKDSRLPGQENDAQICTYSSR